MATINGGEGFYEIGNKAAEIWEIATGKLIATFADESYVSAVTFSPDGRLLVTGTRGEDNLSFNPDLVDQIAR